MFFNEKFDECMKEKKITNYKMCQDTGISDSLIGYWRTGKRKPTLDNLLLISKYLSVSIDYLVNGKPNVSIMLGTTDDIDFSDDEKELLEVYRNLDNRGKHKLQTIAYEELDRINGLIPQENLSKEVG